jgi:hypothetical protein
LASLFIISNFKADGKFSSLIVFSITKGPGKMDHLSMEKEKTRGASRAKTTWIFWMP